ncbi:hypothetical protein RND81_08G050200 [Saponaria officinalis]|uniref:Uncharacterized protein n=1 Tax=Saponaria officinalis TaxID=3572 RepID=A0AAW1J3Q2_SAPOF
MEEPKKHNNPIPLKKRFSPSPKEQQKPTTNTASYDFAFVVRQINVLKDAFEALSDTKFNPKQDVVIQVDQPGCEFSVWNINVKSRHESFGYLSLKACHMDSFQCKNPLQKSFSLKGIPELFRSADKFKARCLVLYVREGSNQISFKWGHNSLDFGYGFPVNVELKDVDPRMARFPRCLSYVYEGVLHSSIIQKMSVKLQNQSEPIPDTVVMSFQRATMEIMADEMTASSMEDADEEELQVATEWKHWESLESASRSATKASVYLVTEPGREVMVRFHLDQLGDLIYLSQADFQLLSPLPLLGRFRTLN